MKSTREVFGNKVRVRVCGLCFNNDAILLVKHNIDGEMLWAPPGGGVGFGETLADALIREFREETTLSIIPGKFLFLTEYINLPLHAIELFYGIKNYSGTLKVGSDPEANERVIVEDVGFFDSEELSQLPNEQLHISLKIYNNPLQLLDKQGHIQIP